MNDMKLTHTKTSPIYLELDPEDDKRAAILLVLLATGTRTLYIPGNFACGKENMGIVRKCTMLH
jgi:hypothetical protein